MVCEVDASMQQARVKWCEGVDGLNKQVSVHLKNHHLQLPDLHIQQLQESESQCVAGHSSGIRNRSQSTEHERSPIPGCRSRSRSTERSHSPTGHHRNYSVRQAATPSII